jgi:3-oxoacyl-[acyl-carrier-protein] synthase-3
MVDYTDRATCPIFGDGAAAFMLEPTTEDVGIMDAILRTDGKGLPFLHMKAGGSVCPPSYFTVDNHMHYIYQKDVLCLSMPYPICRMLARPLPRKTV